MDAYRNMKRPSRVVLSAAMYTGAVAGGAEVARLLFPGLFDSWAASMFGTAFTVMAVRGAADDFAEGFQRQLPKVARRTGKEGMEGIIDKTDDQTRKSLRYTENTYCSKCHVEFDIEGGEFRGIPTEDHSWPGVWRREHVGKLEIGDMGEDTLEDFVRNKKKLDIYSGEFQKPGGPKTGHDFFWFEDGDLIIADSKGSGSKGPYDYGLSSREIGRDNIKQGHYDNIKDNFEQFPKTGLRTDGPGDQSR